MLKCLILAATMASALPAFGQSYEIYWGKTKLGGLEYAAAGGKATVQSAFDNTPFGVFNGSYKAVSQSRAGAVDYQGKSLSSNKDRTVTMHLQSGTVTEVAISPEADRNEFTDAAKLPPDVLNPVDGFGRLISGTSCPAAFRIYDGRRVIQVTPGNASVTGGVTSCKLDYRVILGPGHLSPLRFKNIGITMTYDPKIAATGPALMAVSAGMFEIDFRRN